MKRFPHPAREEPWAPRIAIALGVVLVVAALVALGSGRIFDLSSGGGDGGDCPIESAPQLATISHAEALGLRADVFSAVAADPDLKVLEFGPVPAGVVWTDVEPGRTAVPAGPSAGGYEVRWRTKKGDVIAADGLTFASERDARRFLPVAASAECRSHATLDRNPYPPDSRNLSWTNPDGFAQQDVYLQRGRRVYRVATVIAFGGEQADFVGRGRGYEIVNRVACFLPAAGCRGLGDAAA